MHRLANRQKSFKGQKRIKAGKSTVTVRWPHPDTFSATPETLAEAGFYWTPATGDEDAATCYKCQKEISDWTEEDDPFDIHFTKCAKSCSWAFLRCGLRTDVKDGRFVSTDKNRFPNSKAMENARLDTFVDWKHDKTKNSTCSSKKLAHAGFISGQLDDNDDDLAMCIYCDTSLTGWADGDDPMEEHRTRSAKSKKSCPFIEFASATTLGRSTSRAKSKASDLLMPTKTFDGGDDFSEAASSRSTGKGGKAPRRGRSDASPADDEVTARPTRSRTASTARPASRAPSSRTKPKPIAETEEEAEEEEDEVPEIAPRAAPSKATRTRAKSKAPESDENEAPPPPRTRKQSTRNKANKTSDTEDAKPLTKSRSKKVVADEEEDAPTLRTNASRSTKKALLSEDEQPELPKKTKGKGKAKALPPPSEDDEDEEERATLRKSTRGKPSVKAKAIPASDDEEIETAASLRKSTRGKSKAKTPVSSDEDEEEPEPVPKKSAKGKKSKIAPPPASEEEDEPVVVPKKPIKGKKTQPVDVAKASKANAPRSTKTHFTSDDGSGDDLVIQSSPARLPAKVHPLVEDSGSEPDMVVDEPASVPVKSQKAKEKAPPAAPPRKAPKSQDKPAEGSSQSKNAGSSRSKQPPVGPKKGKKASAIQNADDDGDEVFMDAMDELPDDTNMEVDTVKQSRSSKASPSSDLSSLPSSNPPSSSLTSLSSSKPPSTRPLVPSASLFRTSSSSSQTSKPPSTAKKPVSQSDKTMEVEVLSSDDEQVAPKTKAQPKAKAKTKEASFIPQPSETKSKELERKKLQNNVGKLATKFEFPTKPASSSTLQSRLFPPSKRSPSPPVRFKPSPPPRQPSPLARPHPKKEKTPAPAPKPVPPPAPPETPDVDMNERSFTPEPAIPPDDNDTIMFVATPPQKLTRPPPQAKPPSTALPLAGPAPPTLSESFIPILASEPFVPTTELTEEELNMSVEDWILSQMRRESRSFLADAQRQVARYDTRVMEVRRTIQAKLEESI